MSPLQNPGLRPEQRAKVPKGEGARERRLTVSVQCNLGSPKAQATAALEGGWLGTSPHFSEVTADVFAGVSAHHAQKLLVNFLNG
jgi:hypothetical protein